jgi:hypothetical protein
MAFTISVEKLPGSSTVILRRQSNEPVVRTSPAARVAGLDGESTRGADILARAQTSTDLHAL